MERHHDDTHLSTRDGDKSAATDPAVGVYVDGIFIPRSNSQLVDVISVESIQVLRGPQGTLFGKNTASGALLITSVKPHDTLAGEIAAPQTCQAAATPLQGLTTPGDSRLLLDACADSTALAYSGKWSPPCWA